MFIKAIENDDTVSSEYLVRGGAGKEYKPADYLELFAKFVKENTAEIEAIRILLEEPAGWGTAALTELRSKLTTAPERLTVEKLQTAHHANHKKALVDIISMVKHAAKETEPLLTATEWVGKVSDSLTAGKTFAPEQQAWLARICEHLVANLSIDKDDFDTVPVLSDAGGWDRANKVFDGKLAELVQARLSII